MNSVYFAEIGPKLIDPTQFLDRNNFLRNERDVCMFVSLCVCLRVYECVCFYVLMLYSLQEYCACVTAAISKINKVFFMPLKLRALGSDRRTK